MSPTDPEPKCLRDPRRAARTRARCARGSARVRRPTLPAGGFTLIELILGVAIVGILATIATYSYGTYMDRARVLQAVGDLRTIDAAIVRFGVERQGALPSSLADVGFDKLLDPWGHTYSYLNHLTAKNTQGFRKDKFIVPLNSDYDLYSNGKDGQTQAPLTAKASRDDIVRANDGRFFGLASDYDP